MTTPATTLWEQIAEGFRGGVSPFQGYIFFGVVGFVLLVIAVAVVRWQISPEMRARRRRRARFDEIAAASGLSARERGILWKIARAEEMEDPLEVYFRRSVFEAGVGNISATSDEVSALRGKLYRW